MDARAKAMVSRSSTSALWDGADFAASTADVRPSPFSGSSGAFAGRLRLDEESPNAVLEQGSLGLRRASEIEIEQIYCQILSLRHFYATALPSIRLFESAARPSKNSAILR
jgi:hypothetical protein